MHLSPRDRIRDLNRLKESEEAATFPAHGKASSFWSTSSGSPTIRIKEDGSRGGLERNQSGSAAKRSLRRYGGLCCAVISDSRPISALVKWG